MRLGVSANAYCSMAEHAVDVRAVNGGVAAGTPTRATTETCGVRNVADENFTAGGVHLGVTFETQIDVALNQHFVGDRTMRVMANDAAFPKCFMFENKRSGLLAMTFGAGLIHSCETGLRANAESGAMRGFEDVRAMGIMALHAIHAILQNRVAIWQLELRMNIQMAGEAGLRLASGVDDEFAATTAGVDVNTAGPMA